MKEEEAVSTRKEERGDRESVTEGTNGQTDREGNREIERKG